MTKSNDKAVNSDEQIRDELAEKFFTVEMVDTIIIEFKHAYKEGFDAAFALNKEEINLCRERLGQAGYKVLEGRLQLKAERDRLREALQKIAEAKCPPYMAHPQSVWWDIHIQPIARAALKEDE